jgi:membrane protein YdbS with pleckstrin-like domain
MRLSTMFAIGSILCLLLAIYLGFLAYLSRSTTLSTVAYAVLCAVSLSISITTILRVRHYKRLEKAKPK